MACCHRRLALAATLLVGLYGCEGEVRSVEYYLSHPDQRGAVQLSCVKEPEKHRPAQDCANAAAAFDAHLAQYLPPPLPEVE